MNYLQVLRHASEKHPGNTSPVAILSGFKPGCQDAGHPCQHVEQAYKDRRLATMKYVYVYVYVYDYVYVYVWLSVCLSNVT